MHRFRLASLPARISAGLIALAAPLGAAPAGAQSLLDHPPNISGVWIPPAGVIQFNFVHRFSRSPAPERKVIGFPAFVVATGLPAGTAAGFAYATNSTVVADYPNEWELFLRAGLLNEERGAPLDVGIHSGYNLATEGLDAEVALGRTAGPARLLAVMRVLSPIDEGRRILATGGGGTFRIRRQVAVAGDVVALLGGIEGARRYAWSAGIHLGVPGSPHTLSLHASNAAAGSLQGASRAGPSTRFGFEFTIPITLARYLGASRDDRAPVRLRGDTVRVSITGLKFVPAAIEIAPGTTVIWSNADPIDHSVTASDSTFDSGLLRPGSTWSTTFVRPGTVEYACRPHPVMRARILIRGGP